MEAQETNTPITVEVEADRPVTDPEIELAIEQQTELPKAPANPDAWLQWALIVGLLAIFLICAILILVAWNDR